MDAERVLENIAEAPAEILEDGIAIANEAQKALISKRPYKMAEEYLHTLGPGLTTGAADDDPSGIATYSQTGARYGFQLLWLSLFTFPLMAIVQEMCARIAITTGEGLAANIRRHYPAWVLYACTTLLFAANSFNIGADLGAMAKATQLVLPHADFIFLVTLFAVAMLLLQIFTTYARYARYLKYLTLVLLAYVATALLAGLDWHDVAFHTIVPSLDFSSAQMLLICGILGTTISPYLFFWQTSQEIEEEILHGERTLAERRADDPTKARRIKDMRIDVWTGMFFSNIVMFFIIATCAGTLASHGITDIQTADQAAAALRPFAGEWAFLFFALGIIGTGLLAVPILAGSASYAISESFKWRTGLYRKLSQAHAFYGVIIFAMLIGIVLNMIGLDPIKALIYSAVGNGLVAPIVLVCIVGLSSKRTVMGTHANGRITTALGWLTVALMSISGVAAIFALFF